MTPPAQDISGRNWRVGLIVPSSNTTMETEIPAMLRARSTTHGDTFTIHSSRVRMTRVGEEEVRQMDADSLRGALELSDAHCDVLAYACLVAIMAQGHGYHRQAESRLAAAAASNGGAAPVVTSAGALLQALSLLGCRRVAMVAPYMKPLTARVVDYVQEGSGVEVTDVISLEVDDNLEVGRLDPQSLLQTYRRLDLHDVDALVLSACVQMPSLPVVQRVEDECGLPVVTAATATVHQILVRLGLDPVVPNVGRLLAGASSRRRAAATGFRPRRLSR